MHTKKVNVLRMVICAMLAAVYVVLGFFAINMGAYKFTVEALPVVIAAIAFGPVEAVIVGFIGEFINQLMGAYGLTVTTLLWVLPAVARALVLSLGLMPLKKRWGLEKLLKTKRVAWVFGFGWLAGAATSCFSTLAWYVDAIVFGYLTEKTRILIFGAFGLRIVFGLITATVLTLIAVPVALALKRARVIKIDMTTTLEGNDNERK